MHASFKFTKEKLKHTSPNWHLSPSYPLIQKQVLFRIQMPACLQGGSQIALMSKTKGRDTPRGPSDPPIQIPVRVARTASKSCIDVQQRNPIFISTLLQGPRRTETTGQSGFGLNTEMCSLVPLLERHNSEWRHRWYSTNRGVRVHTCLCVWFMAWMWAHYKKYKTVP